ncbi:thiamine ABC transporter substrate-binding protein [Pseudobdellovibrio sp. HCB154]|uniref:thiamine ABC transporter substrate-binding protein n=1 Tax=Pseudobdellovibrio sp. HCB154 TaxID=3386277 RepID=UPI003916E1DD
MKHFLAFVAVIFSCLTVFYFYRDDGQASADYTSLKVYGSGSFIGSWGPGPKLKEVFEKQTGIKITYLEMSDPALVFQKISFEGNQAVGDVILSLDQYDIARSADKLTWKTIESKTSFNLPENLKELEKMEQFKAYDWAPIAFVSRDDLKVTIEKLDDLLKPELKGRIALEDPRTSSPGLNFLAWIYKVKPEAEADSFVKQLMVQAHSFSPSWSGAYGLFKNKQADIVLSYATSPVYHLVEEKDSHFTAIEFKEGHPIQVEFAGVPDSCINCDAGVRFVQFLQTPEAQKIIMEKNYMFPMVKSVQEGTAFDGVKNFKLLPFKIEMKEQLQKWLGTWSELRKNEG